MSKPRNHRKEGKDDYRPRIKTPDMERLMQKYGDALKPGGQLPPGAAEEIRRAIKRRPIVEDPADQAGDDD